MRRTGERRRRRFLEMRQNLQALANVNAFSMVCSVTEMSVRRKEAPRRTSRDALVPVPAGEMLVPAPAKVDKVGENWRLENPTTSRWLRCRAMVGIKTLDLAVVAPKATLTLPAERFSPELSILDGGKRLELLCAEQRPIP